MKIAVYTIAKNESQFVERWYNSAKDADVLFILDTGSTDDTVEKAKALGITVESLTIDPWRFDVARQYSMDALPKDVDICIALDMDEVLQPGWRKHLESMPEVTTRPRYKYTWSWKPDGTPDLEYGGDKIHARHGYKWKHPVHEVLLTEGVEVQNWIDLEIHHHPDSNKSRSQYFPLLELAVEEDPTNDRNLFYLGREYYYHNMPDKAIETFEKYLKHATWSAERCAAFRFMAKCNPAKAREYLFHATEESPRKEAYLELALHYYNNKDWKNCYLYAADASRIVEKPLDYLCESWAWSGMEYDLLAISCWNLSMWDKALEYGKKALELEPENIRLIENIKFYKNKVEEIDANIRTDGR